MQNFIRAKGCYRIVLAIRHIMRVKYVIVNFLVAILER